MFIRTIFRTFFSFAVAFFVSCGGGGGGSSSSSGVSGVWEGSYQISTYSGVVKYPVCLEINQSGGSLSGKGWIGGSLWKENIIGSISGNSVNMSLSGNDTFNNHVDVNIDANVVANRMTGTLTKNSSNFNLDVRKTSKSSCNWADKNLVDAFARNLSRAITNNPDDSSGKILASFITMVPFVDVKINGTTYNDWWICIWEVRDNVNHKEYTVASIIDISSGDKGVYWYVNDDDLHNPPYYIGLDTSYNSRLVNITGLNNFSADPNKVAAYGNFSTSFFFFANGGPEDVYHNDGTSLMGTAFWEGACNSGAKTKVFMTEIPFYLYFDNGSNSVAAPPNAPSSTVTVPALYVEINPC